MFAGGFAGGPSFGRIPAAPPLKSRNPLGLPLRAARAVRQGFFAGALWWTDFAERGTQRRLFWNFWKTSAHHRHAVAQELLDEAGVVFALSEGLVVHDRLLEGNRGLDSSDHVFVESPRHAFDAS